MPLADTLLVHAGKGRRCGPSAAPPPPSQHATVLGNAVAAACAVGGDASALQALCSAAGGSEGAPWRQAASRASQLFALHGARDAAFLEAWRAMARKVVRAMVDAQLPRAGGAHAAAPAPAERFLSALASEGGAACAALVLAACSEAFSALTAEAQRLVRAAAALPSEALAAEAAADTAPRLSAAARSLVAASAAAVDALLRTSAGLAPPLAAANAFGGEQVASEVRLQLEHTRHTATALEASLAAMLGSGGATASLFRSQYAAFGQCVQLMAECCETAVGLLAAVEEAHEGPRLPVGRDIHDRAPMDTQGSRPTPYYSQSQLVGSQPHSQPGVGMH